VLDSNFAADGDGLSDQEMLSGHQGLLIDLNTGLVYNRNRVLHPTLGRFAQRDPLSFVDGPSLYQYVSSSPMVYNDPRGLERWVDLPRGVRETHPDFAQLLIRPLFI
jgi:RHS repeat-associated protein